MPKKSSGNAKKLLNVIGKSWTDAGFKKKLMADPKGTLASEGIKVPDNANVHVIDQQPNDVHLVLPAKPTANVSVKPGGKMSTAPLTLIGKTPGTSDLTDITCVHGPVTAKLTFMCVGPKKAAQPKPKAKKAGKK